MRILLLCFLSSLAAPGCLLSKTCTEADCVDNATFTLASPTLTAGTYRVQITRGTDTLLVMECALALGRMCGGPNFFDGISLTESGGTPTLLVRSSHIAPTMRIAITKDGAPLASKEVTPVYKTVAPNGESCGPVCSAASVTLAQGDL